MVMSKSMFLMVILLTLSSGKSWGALVQWSGNAHWYEAVSVGVGGISWTDANALAVAQGGYLATVTSQAENEFIFSLIQSQEFWKNDGVNSEGPWLGAQYVGDPATIDDVNWQWVTGEAWGYTNFAAGEPNNTGLDEPYLNYFALKGLGTVFDSTWNNMPNVWPLPGDPGYTGTNTEVLGYIIEWGMTPVPVPPAIWLFGSGLLGIFVTGRKARSRVKSC